MNSSFVSPPILPSRSSNNGTQIAYSNVQPTSSVNTIKKIAAIEASETLTAS